jgi:hypothetical protein
MEWLRWGFGFGPGPDLVLPPPLEPVPEDRQVSDLIFLDRSLHYIMYTDVRHTKLRFMHKYKDNRKYCVITLPMDLFHRFFA